MHFFAKSEFLFSQYIVKLIRAADSDPQAGLYWHSLVGGKLLDMFNNPFSFKGRIRRIEYFLSVLFQAIIFFPIVFLTQDIAYEREFFGLSL